MDKEQASLDYLVSLLHVKLGDEDNVREDNPDRVYFRFKTCDNKFLIECLRLSLSAFNSYPPCTYYKFEDEEFCKYFADLLVTYAAYIVYDAKKYEGIADKEFHFWYSLIADVKNDERFYNEWVLDESETSE